MQVIADRDRDAVRSQGAHAGNGRFDHAVSHDIAAIAALNRRFKGRADCRPTGGCRNLETRSLTL
jgi:hypothetical protein